MARNECAGYPKRYAYSETEGKSAPETAVALLPGGPGESPAPAAEALTMGHARTLTFYRARTLEGM